MILFLQDLHLHIAKACLPQFQAIHALIMSREDSPPQLKAWFDYQSHHMRIQLFTRSFLNRFLQTQIMLSEIFEHCCEHIYISTLYAVQSLFKSKSWSSSLKLAAQSSQQSYQDLKSKDHRQVHEICLDLLRLLQHQGSQITLLLPILLPKEWFLWFSSELNHESSLCLKFQSNLLLLCRIPINLQRSCYFVLGLQKQICNCKSRFTHVQICPLADPPF